MTCVCGDVGLVVVKYRDDSPFDVCVCSCRIGQRFRQKFSSALLARFYQIPVERVKFIEDVADGAAELAAWGIVKATPAADHMQAGKVAPKARL